MNKSLLSILFTLMAVMSAYALQQNPFDPEARMLAKLNAAKQAMSSTIQDAPATQDANIQMMKLGPQKVFNSVSDLYGDWMVNYSDGQQQYFTITISAGIGSNKVKISGWWIGSLATDFYATVSLAGGMGTLTIPAHTLVVDVDGYDQGYLVNSTNTSSDISFSINQSNSISSSVKWGIQTSSGGYYTLNTGFTMWKPCNGRMRYTIATYDDNGNVTGQETYIDPVLMGQNSAARESRLTIFNFFGLGTMINDGIIMKSDSTFEFPPALLYEDTQYGGRYYNYGTDGVNRWTITGKGNEARLTFDTGWSLCSPSTDEWMGMITNTTLFYTDGTTFKYPEPTPESISLNITDADEQVVEPGSTLQLIATILPLGADQTVTWSSSDETVATVDENGLVTAVPEPQNAPAKAPRLEGGGKTVTITATSVANPTLSASVLLYVGYPVTGLFGDLNFDGVVDIADVNVLINILLGKQQ